MRHLIVLCLVGLVTNLALAEDYLPEDPCNRQGGICVQKSECPELAGEGLCPQQQSQGVECCQAVPVKGKQCNDIGGECMNYCHPNVRVMDAVGCTTPEYCCILVV